MELKNLKKIWITIMTYLTEKIIVPELIEVKE